MYQCDMLSCTVLGKISRRGIHRSDVILFLLFWGASTPIPIALVLIFTPTSSVENSFLPIFSPSFLFIQFDAHYFWSNMVFQSHFNVQSSNDQRYWTCFSCIYWQFTPFFWEVLNHFRCLVLIGSSMRE